MASDANGGTSNFYVVPPPQRPRYIDLYDLYDMDEANKEEMEGMKIDEQGYTHVLLHGCFVCPYCNLAHRQ
jgi:hypothetical protein